MRSVVGCVRQSVAFSMMCALALSACENPKPTSGPLLVIDPSALVIGLPSEGSDYQEASLRLSNGGGADVLITNLQLIEEDDTPELTLLDADDWQGRVTLQPGESRELRVGWRLLDAQADRGEIRLRSNDGDRVVSIETADPDAEVNLTTTPMGERSPAGLVVTMDQAVGGAWQRAEVNLLSLGRAPVVP